MANIVDAIQFSNAADSSTWPQLSSPAANLLAVQNGDLRLDATRRIGFLGDAAVLTGAAQAERLRITAAGNVGIGTTAPTQALDVNGSVNAAAYLLNGAPLAVSQWQSGAAGAISYSGGNVGIGTATPALKLDVQGDLGRTDGPITLQLWGARLSAASDDSLSLTSPKELKLTASHLAVGAVPATPATNPLLLDVASRMRVCGDGNNTAGIWFFHGPANKDLAFVGLTGGNEVGFWGSTGVGWGLKMDVSNGNTAVTGALTVGGHLSAASASFGTFQITNVSASSVATGTLTVTCIGPAPNTTVTTFTAQTVSTQRDFQVGGTLTKAAGAFQIDHPLDPANKYLSHSFVESPEMLNVYDGTVTTDAEGLAVVCLPSYFQALNRDFRYQLTVIGRFAQAIVAREIRDDCFVIRSDEPGVKVCWQVTGVRKDPYAVAHPIQVEQEKTARERGRYLHPELYGADASRCVVNA